MDMILRGLMCGESFASCPAVLGLVLTTVIDYNRTLFIFMNININIKYCAQSKKYFL